MQRKKDRLDETKKLTDDSLLEYYNTSYFCVTTNDFICSILLKATQLKNRLVINRDNINQELYMYLSRNMWH